MKREVSKIVLIELVSVYSRAGFEEPLFLASYSYKKNQGKDFRDRF